MEENEVAAENNEEEIEFLSLALSSLEVEDWNGSELDRTLRKVYFSARDGKVGILCQILASQESKEDQEYLLKTPYQDGIGQKCPAFAIAARNGHVHVVDSLISKFNVDVEMTGKVHFENYIIEGACALWCASAAGHLEVVKCLLNHGADVNHSTKNRSTPLRAACFDGRLDIVKYLVETGKGDFNIANKFNNTCLMIAAFKGHVNVLEYLLSRGVNPDVTANCGATALHFASETGYLEVVKILVEFGKANPMVKNNTGLTPLMAAAEHCQIPVFDYLFERCSAILSQEEKIDALELLGASFANDKDHHNDALCYEYLLKAMTLRWKDPKIPISKKNLQIIEAYDNHEESENLVELESRQHLPHKLHMEGLAIRERILGQLSPEIPHPIIYRGAVCADSTDFDRCVKLWLHAMQLKEKQSSSNSMTKDVLRFAQVFCQMIHLGVDIDFNEFLVVMEATANAIDIILNRLDSQTEDKDEPDTLMEELDSNMLTFLYLVVIFGKLGGGEMDIFRAMKVIHRVVGDIKPKSYQTGKTLLHLAVDSDTPVNDFHTSDVVQFPCAKTTKLLIEAGIDVQTMDEDGNTPLHLIVSYQRVVADFLTLHSIITSLVDNGAHVDVVNKNGKTPMAKATTGVAEIILKSQQKISLKCLSAQAVRRHGLSFRGQVPATLEKFIILHGPLDLN